MQEAKMHIYFRFMAVFSVPWDKKNPLFQTIDLFHPTACE
ncbi:hypothetical protein QSI_3124 [Clostridioides difficile P28]|nr:hypothetical protein QSI_3124 [Clostridioides difficile P28]